MIGLYWGRFNPPHKGHMAVIKRLLKEVDALIIAIGAAELKGTKRNPFDGEERAKMMEAYLKEAGINSDRINVVPVPDGKSYSSAISNLFRLCPKFDVAYMSDEKEGISELLGKKTRVKVFKRTGTVSSTGIRGAIANGKKWEHLTGKSVARIIKQLNGIERIKRAYK